MVPNFTGRQSECEEIISHVTSEATRLVSIWGSPGFGKTSVAIAVGHALQSQGLPVCWVSLRGLQSKAELTSKLLSFVSQPATNGQPSVPHLSHDDELCQLIGEISKRFVFILDNADDLLESGLPKVKEEVMQLLEQILTQNQRVTFAVTTRESFEFMDLHFQGHQGVRIRPLDEDSAQTLVHELLPNASASDCTQIRKICGHVPLAMKLLCSLISEDSVPPSQFLDDFMKSPTESIVDTLDNPDYPPSHRLQLLFGSSFQRLTARDQEALVSLSILPENFSLEVASAVLGKTRVSEARKILQRLRRKSLLDSSSKPGSFTMHKLLQSFAREKGESEMNETILNSKGRLNAFYISLFEKLNEQFLTGHSMTAFVAFYEDKQSIVQSLIESCLDVKTADSVFEVLVKAELFLDTLFWSASEGTNFDDIYDSALKASKLQGKDKYYRQLLTSRAFSEVTWGPNGNTMHFLSKRNEIQASSSPIPTDEKGKHLCYLGIYQLVTRDTKSGVQCLHEALSLLDKCDNPEQTILRLVIFLLLIVYCQSLNDFSSASFFYNKALQECKAAGNSQLLIVPPMKTKTTETDDEIKLQKDTGILSNQPLKFQMAFLLSKATKFCSDTKTEQYMGNVLLQILKEIETEVLDSLGLFSFYHNVAELLRSFKKIEDPVKLYESRISYHQTALKKCKENSPNNDNFGSFNQVHSEALAKCYLKLGKVYYSMMNYSEALQAQQRALEITIKLFGEEHESTADSYSQLSLTQRNMGDFTSALHSDQRALAIRIKLFGEEHESTANSYRKLGVTQYTMGDFTSALQSHQRALAIRIKLLEEEHVSTADSYRELGVTQHRMGDFTSALKSRQRALAISIKLFGEEHESTADSYRELGVTQHTMADFTSALHSVQRALAIRIKLFGEEHDRTADSYTQLSVTQHKMGDFTSALQSHQRALAIRIKLFGEEHESTADSYRQLGITQYTMGDFTSALQSHQRALAIRFKLFGEEHESTADSYRELGVTQHKMGDFTSALQSHQRALAIRIKLFGEEHESTADSYRELGVTQHKMGDFTSALQSHKRALAIRIKLFGEEHESTADSYKELGVTQYKMGDFTSALQSHQRALAIRIKLFGEEHESTADSYRELGVTQHTMADFTSALHSDQRALAIRIKLFGEEHDRTADSYTQLSVTQHKMGDFTSAIHSAQRALAIRIKVFGEQHESTADSYKELGVTQSKMGNFTSALQSHQRALAIRIKLFGEELESTANSYRQLGVTQHKMGVFTSALQSYQRALAIRIKLFGEEHESTADSYRELGVTQHNMGDFTSALQSHQRALAIRIKLFGEEHESTADSYRELGVTQHKMGDFTLALQSHQREQAIRIKLFGEEHDRTADSYRQLGVTQYKMGDFTSALQSHQRALAIRIKLFGEEDERTADSYGELGATQYKMGDFTSALQSHQRALAIRIKLFGKEHKSTADSYRQLSVTQRKIGDFATAL